ncbi:MAG: hypothetical protein RL322_1718 [Pseudomonadota bacterium]|jgi:acyl-CoA synthetase (NDP forming)
METLGRPAPGAGLQALFEAKTVAVIGASDDMTKIGGRPVHLLIKHGFKGRIIPVNPRGGTIQGLAAYPSLAESALRPDLSVIAVPAHSALEALKDCLAAGTRAVIVLSSGFAEAGEAGARLQAEMVTLASLSGVRMLGPNCLGAVSPASALIGSFSIVLEDRLPPAGRVGIISQSGNIGSFIMQNVAQRGLGVSRFIATGNEADVDVADGIAALADDPETGLILCCMETCRDASRLILALHCAQRSGKPLVVLKIGRTARGQAAALSHTGALAGSDAVLDAVLRRYGALRVHTVEALLDIGQALAVLVPDRMPRGDRAILVAASGGFGIMMADAMSEAGLALPELSEATASRIHAILPLASTANPVDATAQMSARPEILSGLLEAVLDEPAADIVVLFLSLALYNQRLRGVYLDALASVRTSRPDRLLVVISRGPEEQVMQIRQMGIPVFPSIDGAAFALSGLVGIAGCVREAVTDESFSGRGWVARRSSTQLTSEVFESEHAAKRVLADIGIPVLDEAIAGSADEAARVAHRMGYPVVLKILSPDITHKTEVGGVVLDVRDAQHLHRACKEMLESVAVRMPHARVNGFLIAPYLSGGHELIMGVSRDPVFGPVVMVGFGGIHAEVLKDVALQVAPINHREARAMIEGLRLFPILDGARGQPRADLDAAVDALVRLSNFAVEHQEVVAEVDLNPVRVMPNGRGLWVLDALMVPRLISDTAIAGGDA